MRLWSLHPSYLDSKGLVAVWREGLLAKAVLEGKTKGYNNHPQLVRFKNQNNPPLFLDTYLHHIYLEAEKRGYNFNPQKIGTRKTLQKITVTQGQVLYELNHLKGKLKQRDRNQYQKLKKLDFPNVHPSFKLIPGDIEDWEKLKEKK
ncbi:MAG: hypothetical protein HVN35_07685 [Methanobacteriaceae archaeon]|nr:hypothetical protein [Methanobacteriaceae archaeon]